MAREMLGVALHRSSKRHAEEPEGEQPITKRLARMRIDQPHFQPSVSSPEPEPAILSAEDHMYLDDTKDKVYIHDLESEIAQIEAEEPKSIFLPDIEKKISALPQRLLQNQTNNTNTQMVLYRVPSSISVPEEQDHVRKAIIASRRRAREKRMREAEENREVDANAVGSAKHVNGIVPDQMEADPYDPDAMELG